MDKEIGELLLAYFLILYYLGYSLMKMCRRGKSSIYPKMTAIRRSVTQMSKLASVISRVKIVRSISEMYIKL